MSQFTIAQFTEGNVIASGWWTPAGGQRVYLSTDTNENLIVRRTSEEYDDREVSYTWPRGKSNQEAGKLAWRYYDRKKGEL